MKERAIKVGVAAHDTVLPLGWSMVENAHWFHRSRKSFAGGHVGDLSRTGPEITLVALPRFRTAVTAYAKEQCVS